MRTSLTRGIVALCLAVNLSLTTQVARTRAQDQSSTAQQQPLDGYTPEESAAERALRERSQNPKTPIEL